MGSGRRDLICRRDLIGVLFAGPVFRADGTVAVVDIPTRSMAVSHTQIPVHLGYYVKTSELLSLKPALWTRFDIH